MEQLYYQFALWQTLFRISYSSPSLVALILHAGWPHSSLLIPLLVHHPQIVLSHWSGKGMVPWSSLNSRDAAQCLAHRKTSRNRRLLKRTNSVPLPTPPFTLKHSLQHYLQQIYFHFVMITLPGETFYQASHYYIELESNL